jgi:hypothetical protein
MMGSAVKQLERREREAKGTSMPLRTPSMSERNGFRKRNMSALVIFGLGRTQLRSPLYLDERTS